LGHNFVKCCQNLIIYKKKSIDNLSVSDLYLYKKFFSLSWLRYDKNNNQTLTYYLLVLNIMCVTYFLRQFLCLTSKLSICVTYKINYVSALWHQLAIARCEFHLQTIFQMEIYVKIISIFFPFSDFQSWFYHLPILQTQQAMTSQIRSHIECLRLLDYSYHWLFVPRTFRTTCRPFVPLI